MKNKFVIIDEKGLEIECDILFTFDSEDTGKSYIVYTDNSKDEDGNIQIYANIYDSMSENPRLEIIETEKEKQVIENILYALQESVKAKKESW